MGTKTTIGWEEFLAAGKEGQKSEWVEGEVIYMTPVNFLHELLLARLMDYLGKYCSAHPEWVWVPSNAAFTMASGNWRCPDASLVRVDRYPGRNLPLKRSEIPPDVAFEIYSPSDSPSEIQRKRQDYQESGVVQVWIDPEKHLVELIQPDQPLRYFEEDQSLVIPKLCDFSLDLKNLFSV